MKKVLFFIHDLGGGGAERVLVNLANNLDKTKYDVTIQTIFDVGTNKQYINDDVKYIGGFKRVFPANSQIMKLFSPKVLYKCFVKEKYDYVIAFLEGPASRIISGCNDKNTKKIAWIHVEHNSTEHLSYAFKSISETEQCYNSMDKIICVAETVKSNFINHLDITVPVEVLYNVNESDKIIELSKENINNEFDTGAPNIISVGRLIDMKGYDRLIRIHKKLIDDGINHNIFVLGQGEKENELKAQVKELGVEKTFHFLGFCDNPYKYVLKADLFVCSSRREGFSTAVTESLIVGTPVVSTNVSGAYELLGENNEYGIVTSQDEQELYKAIKSMLIDENKLSDYKEKAFVRGKAFNKEITTKAVEDMLLNL